MENEEPPRGLWNRASNTPCGVLRWVGLLETDVPDALLGAAQFHDKLHGAYDMTQKSALLRREVAQPDVCGHPMRYQCRKYIERLVAVLVAARGRKPGGLPGS